MPEFSNNEPLNAKDLSRLADLEMQDGRYLTKLGMAACIIDESCNVIVNVHEAVDNAFSQGSLGPVMETFRYVPSRGAGCTETPIEVFQRALYEELGVDEVMFEKAGFYFDRGNPISHGEWTFGKRNGYREVFAVGTSLLVRVLNPEVLLSSHRLSEESLGVKLMSIDELTRTNEPMRPGFEQWLSTMMRKFAMPLPQYVKTEIVWQDMPETGSDVLYPFVPDSE